MTDHFFITKQKGEGFFKDRGSKFIGFSHHVESEEEVEHFLESVRKEYHDARHHCYAFILGPEGEAFKANDDVEPSHSAGDPILGQIRPNQLTNTAVVVVRYFGGTKLGVSGLINAYRTTAELALENASLVTKMIQFELQLNFKYQDLNKVMRIIKAQNLQIKSQKMELACEFVLAVNASEFNTVLDIFQSQTGVEVQKI